MPLIQDSAFPLWYRRPLSQIILVGMVFFCSVGMSSAISLLGAGGTQDIRLVHISASVLSATFCIAGFFSGSIQNVLGPRLTLFIGTLGYILSIGGLWCFQAQGTRWFLIFSGAVLGITASLIWAAEGAIVMSYPEEREKGRMIALFWFIFQAGTLIGSIIAFAINVKNGALEPVKTTTYLAIIIIMFFASFLTLFVLPPDMIIRKDGTRVETHATTSVREEVVGFISVFKNRNMLLLLPISFASNFFYTYQGAIIFALFDSSTRGLNGILTAVASIAGAQILGRILDLKGVGRRSRGFLGWSIVVVSVAATWSCGAVYQTGFTRADVLNPVKIHYRDAEFSKPAALIFFYFVGDAFVQTFVYWLMAAQTNEPFKLARYAGYYKAIQTGGAAISFGIDAAAVPYMHELIANFAMLVGSLLLSAFVVADLKEHSEEPVVTEEDATVEELEKEDESRSGSKEE